MPNIAVSFDQQRAVRIGDGAPLVATLHDGGVSRCLGCAAYAVDSSWPSCFSSQAKERLCLDEHRRDGKGIIWRLKNG